METIDTLNNKTFDGDTIHKLVLAATDDEEQAEEAYTQWVNSVGNDKPINIDAMAMAQALTLILGGKQGHAAE
jgi:hypothetical protein